MLRSSAGSPGFELENSSLAVLRIRCTESAASFAVKQFCAVTADDKVITKANRQIDPDFFILCLLNGGYVIQQAIVSPGGCRPPCLKGMLVVLTERRSL